MGRRDFTEGRENNMKEGRGRGDFTKRRGKIVLREGKERLNWKVNKGKIVQQDGCRKER